MDDRAPAQTLRIIGAIGEIAAADWDRLAGGDPFVSHAFLHALEASGSVGGRSGWRPAHLVLESAGRLAAAAPLYLKDHSQGEYVFDHAWADAYQRAGGRYYPKLLGAVPFTPAGGPRLLARTDLDRLHLAEGLKAACARFALSSVHVNFTRDPDAAALKAAGFLERRGVQYHWFNRGYRDFDDFLAALASRKRKALRKERRLAGDGLRIRRLTGDAIEPMHWDAMWRFYQDTGARKWGRPYLTRGFFDIIAQTMKDRILLVVAERDGAPVGGALNIIGPEALYGRYWGCIEHHDFLHFEACYHQAVEFAIERGLSRVEAGAQGEHKIARGYEPVATGSWHWIADAGFRDAVARFLESERTAVDAEIAALGAWTPFRKADDPTDGRETA